MAIFFQEWSNVIANLYFYVIKFGLFIGQILMFEMFGRS